MNGNLAMSGFDLEGKYADVVPKPASSILLVRDGDNGFEVFMVRRHHQIDFASGAMVFPGGKVDAADADPRLRDLCAGAEGLSDADLGFRVSAVREAFEETGVLLATENGEEIGAERATALKDAYAAAMERGETTMAEMATREGLCLRLDRLVPFAHWITPAIMAKRFDTPFFIAEAPHAQVEGAGHDGREAVDSVWIAPADAIAKADAGEVTMVFATRRNLEKLARAHSVEEALSNARNDPPMTINPRVYARDGRRYIEIPEEAGFGGSVFDVGAA
ncbi:NUDIX hydrolase [Futiania mangrovi]|uniref:NUDIX domain-containing protein n=1 Tax=Futiania mangrovi TaxID=2959716 RepID=A0A9J6PA91_9PROT|nr:NUDIX domain-containing protein [Futiania mangrovii]MCP1335305.1 NUDIX domain-containing protein [Futiania mangrovii]